MGSRVNLCFGNGDLEVTRDLETLLLEFVCRAMTVHVRVVHPVTGREVLVPLCSDVLFSRCDDDVMTMRCDAMRQISANPHGQHKPRESKSSPHELDVQSVTELDTDSTNPVVAVLSISQ